MTTGTLDGVRHVLAISAQGIGNTVLALPALADLKAAAPGARVTLLVRDAAQAALFALAEPVDRALAVPSWTGLPRLRRDLGPRPDLTLVMFPHGRASAWLSLLLGGRRRTGHVDDGLHRAGRRLYHHPVPVDRSLHDARQNRALVAAHGIPTGEGARCRFRLPGGLAADIRDRLGVGDGPLVAIHPGCHSDFPEKRWPAARFGETAARLAAETGTRAVALGGPGEEGLIAEVGATAAGAAVSGAGLTLIESAALLATCRLFVGNDSGMMNLAVALGVPTVGIFGPSEEVRTGPLGERSRTVRLGRECRPCWRLASWDGCPFGDARCLSDLPVDDVLAAARDLRTRPAEDAR
jgi:ADP-heptose:LPS heptosyltransferase